MKKKLIITIALVAVTVLAVPGYTLADTANSTSAASSTVTTASGSTASSTSASTSTTPAAPTSLNLSLDDALNMVEKGNSDIALADKEIEIYDRQYQEALAQQKTQQSQGATDESDTEIMKYNVPVALATLNNAKHDRDDKVKSVKVEILSEYENILAAQLNIENINEQISNLQKDMDSINAKINVGLAKASDIEQDKAQMATLQANLSSAQRSIDTAMLTLKQDLGIDLNTKLALTSKPLDYVKFDDTNIDNRIQKAIDNSYESVRQKQDIDNEKILYDIYVQYTDSQQDATEIDIESKQDTLNNLPTTLEVQFKTAYNNLKSLENNVEAQKLSVEAAQISADTAEANYKLGNISYLNLLSAQLSLSTAKNTLQQNIISYMQAVQSFENSLDE